MLNPTQTTTTTTLTPTIPLGGGNVTWPVWLPLRLTCDRVTGRRAHTAKGYSGITVVVRVGGAGVRPLQVIVIATDGATDGGGGWGRKIYTGTVGMSSDKRGRWKQTEVSDTVYLPLNLRERERGGRES